ncbi:MAG: hypothetical protein P8175_12420 [Deltaproteobacteria bacterium]|jgi:hypothetical protein
MSKLSRKIDNRNQLSIFDFVKDYSTSNPTTEARFKIIDQLRAALRSAIKGCPRSRHEIAGEMSHLLGETVTKEMINSWTRESDDINGRTARHIPAEYLPAFCKVTGANEPLFVIGRVVGLFVLPGPDALRAEIQRLDEEIKKTQTRKKERLIFLKEMEKA